MEMNPIYPSIPQRSFAAYVAYGTLDEILCALIVEPLEAMDAAKEFGVAGTPHSLEDFRNLGRSAVRLCLETAATWVSLHADPREALVSIADWDRSVGTWCACQVARTALPFVPKYGDYSRFEVAINAAEKWIVGSVGSNELERAADNAYAGSIEQSEHAAVWAADIAYSNLHPPMGNSPLAYRVVNSACAAFAQSVAVDTRNPGWMNAYNERLSDMRAVISEACLSFPG